MTVRTKAKIKKYGLYILMLILAGIFQNTLHIFPSIYGIRPILLIQVAVSIAMFEGEVVGAVAGFLAGALWDIVTVSADGYVAFYLMVTCAICGMLLRILMRNNFITFIIMNGSITTIFFLFYALLFVGARGIYGSFYMILRAYLPMVIYSLLLSPIFYYLVRAINRKYTVDYDII